MCQESWSSEVKVIMLLSNFSQLEVMILDSRLFLFYTYLQKILEVHVCNVQWRHIICVVIYLKKTCVHIHWVTMTISQQQPLDIECYRYFSCLSFSGLIMVRIDFNVLLHFMQCLCWPIVYSLLCSVYEDKDNIIGFKCC